MYVKFIYQAEADQEICESLTQWAKHHEEGLYVHQLVWDKYMCFTIYCVTGSIILSSTAPA